MTEAIVNGMVLNGIVENSSLAICDPNSST